MLTIDEFVFADAVERFWEARQDAGRRQEEAGSRDQGFRSQVTAGKHMAGFLHTITELIKRAGVDVGLVHPRAVTIPGFYRPTKDWDLLVVGRGRLEAVLELKAQVGPSFGNNFNNRTEEAIGSAVDLWTAFREGAFDTHRPWLGYLFVLEDCPRSRPPLGSTSPTSASSRSSGRHHTPNATSCCVASSCLKGSMTRPASSWLRAKTQCGGRTTRSLTPAWARSSLCRRFSDGLLLRCNREAARAEEGRSRRGVAGLPRLPSHGPGQANVPPVPSDDASCLRPNLGHPPQTSRSSLRAPSGLPCAASEGGAEEACLW